ncbi:type II toxin-antitoxin system RelB family antitoxin [Enterococcus mundtii]|uniref:type II toxin-antitoxin system RelB family antitoxin n=1 Tax=Enterococcus TaxID=1350 RepID=UPI0035C1963A
MSNITFRVSDEEKAFMLAMADLNGMTVSELARKTLLETLEDQIDMDIYNKAMKDHKSLDESISHEEMKRELGL